ncbi:Co/Zn/Cd efflux system component [Pseudomonas pohangensis]|uniref:Co/Zn/Cd efflux system component n=1 Tax=Pseudomonas pohangensis TaxID=364197 RepID=A0A1H2H450_9PSED|nr:cation transporter [Pseudomonas pohangensis]SDU26650.1 Co/Zn/Cd efflux system component [Pseudomonas pohangensis]
MSAHCCNHEVEQNAPRTQGYRRILWIALAVNLLMFAVEIGSGMRAGSVSLLADALDFLGDSANYAISLWVLGLGLAVRARAAQFKALSMLLFGLGVLAVALWNAWRGVLPDAPTMGLVGSLALLANLGVAALLYGYREGDSNMRSVWLCTRNDALGNLAVLLAALGVFGSGTAWPDLLVAGVMASLAISAALQVLRQAHGELQAGGGREHG